MKNPVTLEMLLAQISEDNLHKEVDTGPMVGREELWNALQQIGAKRKAIL